MKDKIMHIITRWNPFWDETDKFEPNTIEVHCEILERFSLNEQYVWYGKISKSGKLGIKKSAINQINSQINSGVETHFYMYCPDKRLLHVGKLEEVSNLDFKEDVHTPLYYSATPRSIPFWFKLSDIRKLDFQNFLSTHILKEEDGEYLDPVSVRGYYPRIVYEDPSQSFFDYGTTHGKKWFFNGGVGGMMPRCFKTGSMDCSNPEADQPVSNKRVFIAMPIRPEMDNAYTYGIKPALKKLDLTPWRADEEFRTIDLMCKVCAGIQISGSAIVDISDWNPNVLFELGLVYGLGKEAFIIKRKDAKVPVDLKGIEYIGYDNFKGLKDSIVKYMARISERG